MSTYRVAVSMPVKITTWVAPWREIPAQTFTFGGCSGFILYHIGWSILRKQNLQCDSDCTAHSSIHTTFSNSTCRSPSSICFWHHSTLFSWFASDIKAQYLVFFATHPSSRLARSTVLSLIHQGLSLLALHGASRMSIRRFRTSAHRWNDSECHNDIFRVGAESNLHNRYGAPQRSAVPHALRNVITYVRKRAYASGRDRCRNGTHELWHEEPSDNDVEAELHTEEDQSQAGRRDSCEQDLIMPFDKEV